MTVHVKICGLTNLADAQVAVEAGADLLGFILYAKSARAVSPQVITTILKELRQYHPTGVHQIRTVGIFVNDSVEHVRSIMAQTGLDLVQIHGDESLEHITQLSTCAYKALRPVSLQPAAQAAAKFSGAVQHAPPSLLIDAYDPTAYGGTGHRADWQIAAEIAAIVPGLMLSGGLTPDNVADAIAAVQPWGVDVSSGVEATPGRKDHTAIRDFVAAAKSTHLSIEPPV